MVSMTNIANCLNKQILSLVVYCTSVSEFLFLIFHTIQTESFSWIVSKNVILALNINLSFSVVIQSYNTYVQTTDVIQGNDIVMKCDVPSFVADFVQVVGWEDETNNVYSSSSVNAQGTLHRQRLI